MSEQDANASDLVEAIFQYISERMLNTSTPNNTNSSTSTSRDECSSFESMASLELDSSSDSSSLSNEGSNPVEEHGSSVPQFDLSVPQINPTAPLPVSVASSMSNLVVKDEDSPVLVSLLDVGTSLLNALECPVCMDYMVPPIGLCCNGHNTCQNCRPKMASCPICRQGFIETRNIAMEGIARELQYPCRNRVAGCDEKYPMELINEHQAVCPRRQYPCMLGCAETCDWKGRRHEILTHAREAHTGHIWVQDKLSLVYTEFESSSHADVIEALGELFVLHRRYDLEKERLYAVVQYLGPTENAALYKYEFEFMELGELRSVLFRNVVHPDTSDTDDIFESGNCVSLGFEVIVNFIKEKELWCTVAVSNV